jgi:hypothetical protein
MFKEKDDLDGAAGSARKLSDEFAAIGTEMDGISGAFETINDLAESNLLNLKGMRDVLLYVDRAAMDISKSFGLGRENATQLKIAMADAYVEIAKMGGTYKDIAAIQGKVSQDLGRNVILQSDTIEKLFAAQEVTGQNAEVITKSFKDAGISAYLASEKMGNVVNIARSQGVNAQAVSKLVVENMSNLNMYTFQGGVDGLAKMAAQATSMRISMQDTFKFAEKVFNPEGAIETAAALQRLGVTQSQLLDPLRLMDLAQNDPTELQNQITQMTEQFVQLNKEGQFEIMPDAKRQLREIETAMGYPSGALSKMALGAAEVADKMSKIRFTGGFSEDEKKFIANMAEMGPGGTYTLKVDGKDMGIDQAMDLFSKDKNRFNEFMKASEPKTMEDLAKDQLDTIKSIQSAVNSMMNRTPIAASGSKVGETILGGYREAYNIPARALSGNAFDTETIRTKFDELGTGVGDMFEKIKSGKVTLEDFKTAFTSFAEGINTFLKGEIKSFIDNGKVETSKVMDGTSKDVTVTGNDFILKTHPKDSIVFTPEMMVGGTNLFGGQQNGMTETKNTNDININVALTSNGADLNQMTKREILEPLVAHIQNVITGDGLLNKNGSTPNPIFNYQVG